MSAVATLKFKAGDRIGRWTVLGEYELTGRNERKWLCRCDCGTERYVVCYTAVLSVAAVCEKNVR